MFRIWWDGISGVSACVIGVFSIWWDCICGVSACVVGVSRIWWDAISGVSACVAVVHVFCLFAIRMCDTELLLITQLLIV